LKKNDVLNFIKVVPTNPSTYELKYRQTQDAEADDE